MSRRYFVVDQNYLRTQSLQELLQGQPEVRLVVPDLAMFEMTKSDNREVTVRLSLATLAQYPSRVFVSRSMSECLKYELGTQRPVNGHLLFRDATQFLRNVLHSVSTGVSNSDYKKVIHDSGDHLSGLKRDYLDHDANKARVLELVDGTKQGMTAEFASRVRGAKATFDEKISFVETKAISLLGGILAEEGMSQQKAMNFIRRRPMLLRYFYLKLWACLTWEEQGRIEGLGVKKVSNDLIDHEYVLAATFFNGVLSNESQVNEAYAAVCCLLKRPLF